MDCTIRVLLDAADAMDALDEDDGYFARRMREHAELLRREDEETQHDLDKALRSIFGDEGAT